MAGLAGIVRFDGAPAEIAALNDMCAMVPYRAAQGVRSWASNGVVLATLASSAADEPVQRGGLVLVGDVRLDNRDELRGMLRQHSEIETDNATDPELVLAAYLRWDEGCVPHLVGAFAFAIWDTRARRLFCARDVFGLKPLFFTARGRFLCFASEARQLLAHPLVSPKLNEHALADHLLSCCDFPSRSMFDQIEQLAPAHQLVVSSNGTRTRQYWDFRPRQLIHYRRDSEYVDHFRACFQRAVSDRLGDEETSVHVLMSGGLDSTSVAAVAHEAASARVRAVSHVFPGLHCDEHALIEAMRAHVGLRVCTLDPEQSELFPPTDSDFPTLNHPFLAWRYPSFWAEVRGAPGSVVLTGHGGDSVLSSHPVVYLDRVLRRDWRVMRELWVHAQLSGVPASRFARHHLMHPLLPDRLRRQMRRLRGRDAPELPAWLATGFAERVQARERLPQPLEFRRLDGGFARYQNAQHAGRLGSVWRAVDYLEMQAAFHGAEARHPFLDRRLMMYLAAIPPEQLLQGGRTKWILRQSMRGELPDAVTTRVGKARFGPLVERLLRARSGEIDRLLKRPLIAQLGLVSAVELRAAFERMGSGAPGEAAVELWFPISLELWLRKHAGPLGLAAR